MLRSVSNTFMFNLMHFHEVSATKKHKKYNMAQVIVACAMRVI